MRANEEYRQASRFIGGILLLSLGALFALQNMGVVRAGSLGDYWPLLLVWMGLSRLVSARPGRSIVPGVVLLLLGVFFQLDRLDLIRARERDLWPVLLVVGGAALIAESLAVKRIPRDAFSASGASREGQS